MWRSGLWFWLHGRLRNNMVFQSLINNLGSLCQTWSSCWSLSWFSNMSMLHTARTGGGETGARTPLVEVRLLATWGGYLSWSCPHPVAFEWSSHLPFWSCLLSHEADPSPIYGRPPCCLCAQTRTEVGKGLINSNTFAANESLRCYSSQENFISQRPLKNCRALDKISDIGISYM